MVINVPVFQIEKGKLHGCIDVVINVPDFQIEKGKLHGCIDVGLSVMAIKKSAQCIDLDAEENIYHLKVYN